MKKVNCCICRKEIEINNDTYYHGMKRHPDNPRFYCKECYKDNKIRNLQNNGWNNISDEQRLERINKIKISYMNKSDAEKQKLKNDQSKLMKEKWNNMSEEEREKRKEFVKNIYSNLPKETKIEISNKMKEHYKNMTPEEKSKIGQNIKDWYNSLSDKEKKEYSEKRKVWYNNLPDEKKQEYSQRQKYYWKNMTEEEYNRQYKLQSEGWKNLSPELRAKYNDDKRQWWDSLSDEEKQKHIEKMNWYKNLSPEEKSLHAKNTIDQWNNYSDKEKSEITKKKLSSARSCNNLNKRFEKLFKDSHLSNDFYIKPEVLLTNEVTHRWDYAIYNKSNNMLEMVVDLDGEFYHADKCDYDGLHSKEEYDEKRSLSVPDGIKITIINEANFAKCFELMIKMLIKNYDEYVDYTFKMCRNMPFPYPHYTEYDLIKSYNDLCKMNCNDKYHQDITLNTRLGDHIITHFHHSIYHAHTKGELSPFEAWYIDDLLLKVIKNRIIYQSYLSPNKILQGFNISKTAIKVSVFSAGRAKLIINKYLSEYDTIFDPFSGFSGRMLGTISLGKKYIGQDISLEHVNESNLMILFLKEYFNIDAIITQKDIMDSYGEYDCLFTCSPYKNKEQWKDVPISMNSCDDWIDICLEHFKCKRYVFIVDESIKYKDYIVYDLTNKSHMNRNCEHIILIDKN